jgi:hypothetical protein
LQNAASLPTGTMTEYRTGFPGRTVTPDAASSLVERSALSRDPEVTAAIRADTVAQHAPDDKA